jgi:hypothetical protein
MSATRDSSQKIHFIPTNFYRLYRQGLEAAKHADLRGIESGRIIKAAQAEARGVQEIQEPRKLRSSTFSPFAQSSAVEQVVRELQGNLEELRAIQGRLRFYSREISEFTRKRSRTE